MPHTSSKLCAAGNVLLTRQEMATRIGTVREMVSRALRELEGRQAISRHHAGRMQIDMAALHALLDDNSMRLERSR